MARETAAQRKEREEEERRINFEKNKGEYPRRLMNAMAEYANIPGFNLKKHAIDGQFMFSDHIHGYDQEYILPAEMTQWEDFYELEQVEYRIQEYYTELEEANRKYRVKQEALAKLSQEEREILGL